ncbi:MAG: N-acetylmuramoyl-L-alanine amidase [Candidatus Marinimicrobia bacterium]|nr:N-acetylmuramoyl-L-alanine amidase [Candidatus Neomarinimicrobiota bacterium]MCF7840477.1 N-acetylmuramoyl-L-alanine amidase [Candidatus Neomarinimicrobiota bacterium]
MKFFKRLLTIAFMVPVMLQADLSGLAICLDPGHGGGPGTGKWFEAVVNFQVALDTEWFLDTQNPDTVVLTVRDSMATQLTLSQREYVANSNNVDYFHSIHHNAFQGTANYTLALYEQLYTGGPAQWPGEADLFADMVSHEIYLALRTTADYGARGDRDFLGFNLGVLNDLTMPGDLSEGSFWDFPPEIRRLQNKAYLKTEAEAILFTFLDYYDAPRPEIGTLDGIVTNTTTNQPASGITVTLSPALTDSVYTTDDLGNGYFRFDSLSPGDYTLTASSEFDTVSVTKTVAAGIINHQDLSLAASAVGAPTLRWVVYMNGSVLVNINPVTGATGYRLFYTDDLSTWPDSQFVDIASASVSLANAFPADTSIYIKAYAFNDVGISEFSSDTYGCYTGDRDYQILVVDGFDRFGGSGSWGEATHDFAARHGRAWTGAGLGFSTIANEIVGTSMLSGFWALDWVLGDESTADETLNADEQTMISAYLNQGGRVFISGSEIAYDLDLQGSVADKDFIHNYLKVSYAGDNADDPYVDGVNGTEFAGLNFTYGLTGSPYPEDWPDYFNATGGGQVVLKYGNNRVAGVAYAGTFTSSTNGYVVTTGFPLETIDAAQEQVNLAARVVDFFTSPVSIVNQVAQIPHTLAISRAFPNPFNGSVTLDLAIPEHADAPILEIFDLAGRRIYQQMLLPGSGAQSVRWTGHTTGGLQVASGVYIARLSDRHQTSQMKLHLVK